MRELETIEPGVGTPEKGSMLNWVIFWHFLQVDEVERPCSRAIAGDIIGSAYEGKAAGNRPGRPVQAAVSSQGPVHR